MAIYGADLDGLTDIDFELTPARNERYGVALAIGRRLITPAGSLWYDPDYGFDVRQYLGAANTTHSGHVEAAVEAEAFKDERVLDAKATVTREEHGRRLKIQLFLVGSAGPARLTLTVAELTAPLLRVET